MQNKYFYVSVLKDTPFLWNDHKMFHVIQAWFLKCSFEAEMINKNSIFIWIFIREVLKLYSKNHKNI